MPTQQSLAASQVRGHLPSRMSQAKTQVPCRFKRSMQHYLLHLFHNASPEEPSYLPHDESGPDHNGGRENNSDQEPRGNTALRTLLEWHPRKKVIQSVRPLSLFPFVEQPPPTAGLAPCARQRQPRHRGRRTSNLASKLTRHLAACILPAAPRTRRGFNRDQWP
jgi:hypothetical protein